MKRYRQLTLEQRYQIKAYLKIGCSQTEITQEVGVHKSTISREIQRNRGMRGYRPKQAQRLAEGRRQSKVKPRISSQTWYKVRGFLKQKMSPEQIQGWLQKNDEEKVSPECVLVQREMGK
ncbi:MAG: helix-turn-helix domain-containing protein [Anaerolineaceae bacterium]|nr:helix-turn-helix domain-containing protein [Anaerolineaceae bacterium]